MKRAGWNVRIDAARQQAKTHRCCVDGCDRDTLLGLLACREHWLALPRPTRYVLGLAFRRHDSDPDIYAEGVRIATRLLNEQAAA